MFCAGATDVAKISLGIPGTVEVLPSILYSIFSAIFYAILSGFVEGHFTPYFGLLGRALHVWLDPVLDCLALKSTHKKTNCIFPGPGIRGFRAPDQVHRDFRNAAQLALDLRDKMCCLAENPAIARAVLRYGLVGLGTPFSQDTGGPCRP